MGRQFSKITNRCKIRKRNWIVIKPNAPTPIPESIAPQNLFSDEKTMVIKNGTVAKKRRNSKCSQRVK
jgi:hypothetical protein